MAASSSMMSTEPSVLVSSRGATKRVMAASGIDHLSDHGEFHDERGTPPGRTVHMDLASVLLNDAVGHRQSQSRTAAVPALRLVLGGEERIVDAVNVHSGGTGLGLAVTYGII